VAGTRAGTLLGSACSDDPSTPPPLDIDDACNPLGTSACLLPWPSAAFLREADTVTGVALDLPADAMPVNTDGVAVSPAAFNRMDGFAPSGAMMVAFPSGVSAEGLPGPDEAEASLAADAPIVVLAVDTGERLPYFAEIDANALFPEDRMLLIRPLVRMRPATRYAVAIRSAVKAADGGALPVPPGFQAILDGRVSAHPRLERLAPRYDAIFDALDAAGVAREDLVLAWDFVTASDEHLTADLLDMRAQAQAAMGENGASLTFTATEQVVDSPLVARFLTGTFQSPNFLTSGEDVGSVLVRDADGRPAQDGLRDARFAALVPACTAEATEARPVLIFGHGLFGSGEGALQDPSLHALANQECVVLVAGDFIGLTSRQLEVVTGAAANLDHAPRITEKLAQSVIDFMALAQIVRGPMAADPLFQLQDRAVMDPERVYYFGASLGGIMGLVVMAYDPSLPRGVLGVPGGAWSLLLERSFAWQTLQLVARNAYAGAFDYQMVSALLGLYFEPYDAITTAARIVEDPLPGTGAKKVLLYQAIGDSLVSNLATEMVARTMGLPVIAPSVRVPGGMVVEPAPLTSALAIYDEQPTPLPPASNLPPVEDNGTHAAINRRGAVVRQVGRFLLEGTIAHECKDGDTSVPCDCTTGACD
jgi:hypothetical protein